jgi:hypothetical protein
MEGGRNATMIIAQGMGCLSSHIPRQREKEKEGPNQAVFFIPTP